LTILTIWFLAIFLRLFFADRRHAPLALAWRARRFLGGLPAPGRP
jgi:hypothetical protein